MKDLIYYPYFEVKNINWLKVALLYVEKLRPIIPDSGEMELSELYSNLKDDINFIKPYRPKLKDREISTVNAIKELEKILSHPEYYESIFGTSDIISKWQDDRSQEFELYQEKFNYEFFRFCKEYSLGCPTRNGMKVNQDIGNLYMSILASDISEKEGKDIITDERRMDRFAVFRNRNQERIEEKIILAQKVINLKIPRDIEGISIDNIVELRRKKSYIENLRAFHNELESYQQSIVEDGNELDFLSYIYQSSSAKELIYHITNLTGRVMSVALGFWGAIGGDDPGHLKLINGTLAGLSVGSNMITTSKTWSQNKSKRHARKYLLEINRLFNR